MYECIITYTELNSISKEFMKEQSRENINTTSRAKLVQYLQEKKRYKKIPGKALTIHYEYDIMHACRFKFEFSSFRG